ncbi:hydroxyacid-oxoacid transhydrogenase, mitochondrial isoform X3 [Leucoraja erinacea]|uniref:hydroxyacid-oxoacid transhydrogenase, mitochondrial isoform X3 n=1 Tax=Leucoraja erinaceus TaxID=7782 RepID=UPI002458DEEE|nr:hydroxyacid-oxoacid transhydrogenase, mitochondrial isoform X3 [Leucoraja erinacea]
MAARERVVDLLRQLQRASCRCPAHSQTYTQAPGHVTTRATDYAFEMACSNIRYGEGVTNEIGMDLQNIGARKVCVMTDRNMAKLPPVKAVLDSLVKNGVNFQIFDKVRVEPSDLSFIEAIKFARQEQFDAYVAVGGGSVIDTCKVANLYSCSPDAEFLDYVNAPIGKGKPVTVNLRPLIAVPTTAGTGSETTGVAVFDYEAMKVKTGIASRALKPLLGIVDPLHTLHMPERVAAYSGFDVLWAVRNADDHEARFSMHLASVFAGIGFGNAGVHLCHGMSYPVAGMVKTFKAKDYNVDHPLVPHGLSVVLTSPAVFAFTGSMCPTRHLEAAEILGTDIRTVKCEDAGLVLADTLRNLLFDLNVEDGLSAVGYTQEDIPALVKGTLPQERVTKLSPKPHTEEDLAALFESSMKLY